MTKHATNNDALLVIAVVAIQNNERNHNLYKFGFNPRARNPQLYSLTHLYRATATGVQETPVVYDEDWGGGGHGGLSAAGAPLPSVLGCVLRTIV